MILIDAIYINSLGGKTILNVFFDELAKEKTLDFKILVDENLYKSNFFSDRNFKSKLIIIKKSSFSRLSYYLKSVWQFDTVLCFSSIPPPFPLFNIDVYIYFHNIFFLKNKFYENNISLLFFIKKLYLRIFTLKSYHFFVQTELIKNRLLDYNFINKNNVFVYPIFQVNKIISTSNTANNYIYLADDSHHKNHEFLITAWIKFFNSIDTNKELNLKLTIDFYKSYLKNIFDYNYLTSKNIIFLGNVSQNEAINLLRLSDFLIYVSKSESFGLPLIEAIHNGCGVIAPDIDYVKEIIEPTMYFSITDNESLVNVLINSQNIKNKFSKIKIRNSVTNIIKLISNV